MNRKLFTKMPFKCEHCEKSRRYGYDQCRVCDGKMKLRVNAQEIYRLGEEVSKHQQINEGLKSENSKLKLDLEMTRHTFEELKAENAKMKAKLVDVSQVQKLQIELSERQQQINELKENNASLEGNCRVYISKLNAAAAAQAHLELKSKAQTPGSQRWLGWLVANGLL